MTFCVQGQADDWFRAAVMALCIVVFSRNRSQSSFVEIESVKVRINRVRINKSTNKQLHVNRLYSRVLI